MKCSAIGPEPMSHRCRTPRMSPANFHAVPRPLHPAAVRAEVPVAKQIGCPVSASIANKVLGGLGGRSSIVVAVEAHVSLAETAYAMGIAASRMASRRPW